MSEMNHLKKIQHEIMCCTGCGYCKKACPTFDMGGTEADSGRGKIFLAYGLLSGEIEEDTSVIQTLQKCTLCGRCEQDCPSLVKISDIIHAARKDLHGVLPAHQKIIDSVAKYGNPFGMESESRKNEQRGVEAGDAKIAYFAGCMENYKEKGLKRAALSIFEKLGVDVAVIDNECCGNPVEIIGRENKQLSKIEKKLDDMAIKKIIFSCPSCMQSFLPLNKKFEIMHISQFLAGMDLNLKDAGMKLIYHDSSVLGRKLGIYEEPRKLLEMAGGFIEFKQHEELAQCCGGDLAFSAAFPDMAEKMAERIVEEAREKNATIVTASPHCYHQLKKYGDVIDIVEVVDRFL